MVRLCRGKQNLFNLAPLKQTRQKRIPPRPERTQNCGHRRAQIIHRTRPRMDRTQHIDQHNLTVDLGKMIAEKRLYDIALVALKAALELATQTTALARKLRQRRKGQHRGSRQIPRQQKPPRRTVGISRLTRRIQMRGKTGGQCLGLSLVQFRIGINARQIRQKCRAIGASFGPRYRSL